jgi:competence protein ComEC
MAPSTLRAALMFSLFIVANISGRRTPTLNLLAAAAIITLLINPLVLKEVGWQLSYSAVCGLILARPAIVAFRNRLWQLVSVSVFATLATLPIVATTFHRLPVYFLIANIIIIPLAGVLLFLSLMYMIVPCDITAWPLHWLTLGIEYVTAWVSSLPGAVVEI